MKVWRITWKGITVLYAARSRGRARYLAALVLDEYWATPPSVSFAQMTCHRAPEVDFLAEASGLEGPVNPCH